MSKSIGLREIRIGGRDVPYRVRYSSRATRLCLRIGREHGLEIVVPHHARGVDFENVVLSKSRWILRKLDHFARLNAAAAGRIARDGSRIPFAGGELTIRIAEGDQRGPSITAEGDTLVVRISDASQENLKTLLERWYRKAAKKLIPQRVEQINLRHRFRYSGISIRNQKTRWGSCSRRGALSFNWRMILLPAPVMDYLILHELAHLREMNHSRAFWALVGQLCPEYRKHEAWLKNSAPLVDL